MSPEQQSKKRIAIRDDIDTARRLVECGWMATQQLEQTEREALAELLDVVNGKLRGVVEGLEATFHVT